MHHPSAMASKALSIVCDGELERGPRPARLLSLVVMWAGQHEGFPCADKGIPGVGEAAGASLAVGFRPRPRGQMLQNATHGKNAALAVRRLPSQPFRSTTIPRVASIHCFSGRPLNNKRWTSCLRVSFGLLNAGSRPWPAGDPSLRSRKYPSGDTKSKTSSFLLSVGSGVRFARLWAAMTHQGNLCGGSRPLLFRDSLG